MEPEQLPEPTEQWLRQLRHLALSARTMAKVKKWLQDNIDNHSPEYWPTIVAVRDFIEEEMKG